MRKFHEEDDWELPFMIDKLGRCQEKLPKKLIFLYKYKQVESAENLFKLMLLFVVPQQAQGSQLTRSNGGFGITTEVRNESRYC